MIRRRQFRAHLALPNLETAIALAMMEKIALAAIDASISDHASQVTGTKPGAPFAS